VTTYIPNQTAAIKKTKFVCTVIESSIEFYLLEKKKGVCFSLDTKKATSFLSAGSGEDVVVVQK
jgi:hypothetical protein